MAQEKAAPMHAQRTALLVLLAAAFALLAASAPAQAHDVRGTQIDGLARYAEWARDWKVPLPPGTITIYNDWCDDHMIESPCADPHTGRLWMTPELGRGQVARQAFAHEVGHVFDLRRLEHCWQRVKGVMTTCRDRLTRLLGFHDGRMWDNGQTGNHCFGRCPSELFADAYALCATRGDRQARRTKRGVLVGGIPISYGYDPSPRRHRAICRTIRSDAERHEHDAEPLE